VSQLSDNPSGHIRSRRICRQAIAPNRQPPALYPENLAQAAVCVDSRFCDNPSSADESPITGVRELHGGLGRWHAADLGAYEEDG
jgi:hypothetical protein